MFCDSLAASCAAVSKDCQNVLFFIGDREKAILHSIAAFLKCFYNMFVHNDLEYFLTFCKNIEYKKMHDILGGRVTSCELFK